MLETYKKHKEKLEETIKELYEGKMNAGIATVGDFTNRIKMLEKLLEEINEKISGQIQVESPPVGSLGKNHLQVIKLFLASSEELKSDRLEFEIFINRENKHLVDKGFFLHLIIWEDFIDALSKTRLQDEYNIAIKKCDLFVSLFFSKLGKFTKEEFEVALASFKDHEKPLIYTYFKDQPQSTRDNQDIKTFKGWLRDLGHFPTSYNSAADLKYNFKMQIDKILPIITK